VVRGSRADPLPLEGPRERFLPEAAFRGRQNAKLQYAVLAAAAVHGGTEPDLLEEVAYWQADDSWQYAAYAAARKLDNSLYNQGGWVCPAASAALPFLVRLAADPAVTVRVMVADLIARIAAEVPDVAAGQVDPDWPGALETAAPVLLSLLDDADPGMRRTAAKLAGAGGLPPELAVPALWARSSRAEPDWAARWDVLISLGAAAAGSALAGEVRGELSGLAQGGGDPQVRLAAVHGLAAVGEPVTGHAGVMTGAMADARWTGWEASEWLGGGPEVIVTETGRLLLDEPGAATAFAADVMDAGDAGQRTAALSHMRTLLGRWHAVPGSVTGFLAGLLDAPEPEVRYRAAYLLACSGAAALPWADQFAGLAADEAAASYHPGVTVGDAAVWELARLGDPRCLPGLRERLLGDRTGFATGNVSFPRDAAMFDLPDIGLIVTRADPDARLLDPVLSRLRRATPTTPCPACSARRSGLGARRPPRRCRNCAACFGAATPPSFPPPPRRTPWDESARTPARQWQNCDTTPGWARRRRSGLCGG